jgi:transcription antitermination factor NusG
MSCQPAKLSGMSALASYSPSLFPEESRSWFAVRVKHQFEMPVASHLRNFGFESLLPLYRARRKWSDRIKIMDAPLFPGYVFCKFDPQNRIPIDLVPGVTGVVSFGRKLAAVDPGEVDAVRAVTSSGLESAPWPRLESGRKVEIDFGPLRGVQGVVVRDIVEGGSSPREQLQLIVSVTLLNRSLAVQINREWIRSLN